MVLAPCDDLPLAEIGRRAQCSMSKASDMVGKAESYLLGLLGLLGLLRVAGVVWGAPADGQAGWSG